LATSDLLDILDYVSVAVYGLVALAAWRLHRRLATHASRWLLITFLTLASVVTLGAVLPDATSASAGWVRLAGDLLVVILLLFPYALYRFAAGFGTPNPAVHAGVHVVLALLIVATFAVPVLPQDRAAFTPPMQAYLYGFLIYWTSLSVWVAARLWRGGRGQPGVARRRMQLLSVGTLVMNAALLLVGLSGSGAAPVQIVTTLLGWSSAVLFLLGFAPPGGLRHAWRQPDERNLRRAEARLMTATTAEEVANTIVPHVSELLGGHGAALLDTDGAPLASQGFSDAQLREITADRTAQAERDRQLLPLRSGSLVVQAGVYAPFFGEEEQSCCARWARSSTSPWGASSCSSRSCRRARSWSEPTRS
jgi:hypothetical protein